MNSLKTFMMLTKALSDTNRVRMLLALRTGELCVCQLIDLLRLAPSTVSKHLSLLDHAGLIESRKAGRWVYYRLATPRHDAHAARLMKTTLKSLADSPDIGEDTRRLNAIRRTDPEALCRRLLKKK